jgi:hypothetical protein
LIIDALDLKFGCAKLLGYFVNECFELDAVVATRSQNLDFHGNLLWYQTT